MEQRRGCSIVCTRRGAWQLLVENRQDDAQEQNTQPSQKSIQLGHEAHVEGAESSEFRYEVYGK